MAKINVSSRTADSDVDPQEFRVEIEDSNKSKTTHEVKVTKETHQRLTGGIKSAEELVRASFEFLLEHEPKESILPKFDLSQIQSYFPEYETVISTRVAK